MSKDKAKEVWSWFSENNNYLNTRFSNKRDYHKKLQKLCFMAYGIYLARHSKKMFTPCFEAWTEGPVCNTIYAQIMENDMASSIELDENVIEVLNQVNQIYGCYSADALSEMTHELDSWNDFFERDEYGNPIPYIKISDKVIKKEFESINNNIQIMLESIKDVECQLINDVTVKFHKNDIKKYLDNYEEIKTICEDIRKENNYVLFLEFEGSEMLYEIL